MRRGAEATLVCATLAVAAWLRFRDLGARELWLDDLDRVRMSAYSWEAIATRLPCLDPMKSPYLVGLHKLWTLAAGTSSLEAIRAYPAVLGVVLVAAVWLAARAAAGAVPALVVGALYAVHPFFVRWSVEVHEYAPAAILVAVAWWIVLRRDTLSRGTALWAGAICGAAVGMFPPAALALVPLVLLPRARTHWTVAGAAAALVAAPAIVAVARSWSIHQPAYAAGLAWSPYFNARKTPFEVAARLAGADVRQGAFTIWMAAGTALALAAAVAGLVVSRSNPSRTAWTGRVAFCAAGIVPMAALCALSMRGTGWFNDRYAHGASALLPAALVVAVAGGTAGWLAWLPRAAVAAAFLPLAGGVAGMLLDGPAFPRDSASYRYQGASLAVETASESGAPDLVLVHGEAQTGQFLLRCPPGSLRDAVRHLSTDAWSRVLAADETGRVSIPHAYGWPFALRELSRTELTLGRTDAAARVAASRRVWVLLEDPGIRRTRHLEEEEEAKGLEDAWSRVREPRSPSRDAAIAAGVARYLGVNAPRHARVAAASAHAVIVEIE